MLTEAQLRAIMPNLPASKAAVLLPHLNNAMAEYGIDSMMRTAAFVAQLAHESGEFRWMEELWGPTPAQRRYEPVTDLSQRLGNTEPGDGKRFKGRGPIQLTGRANYQRFGGLLGLDLVGAPERAAAPETAFRVAALYWKSRGLNELADADAFREITRRINGGFNGLADRQNYYSRAKAVLATAFEAGVRSATRAMAMRSARALPAEPLTRGFEVIRELAAPRKARGKRKAAARNKPTKQKAAVTKGARTKAANKPPSTRAAKKPAKAPARKTSKTRPAPAKKSSARPTAKRSTPKRPAARKPAVNNRGASKPSPTRPVAKKPRTKGTGTRKRA